jgi:hypothetical protein
MPGRDSTADLAGYFRLFAIQECGDLPLYRRLNLGAAEDRDLLDLMVRVVPQGQRRPNLILAAVHHLLLGGAESPLARWYPTLNGGVAPPPVDEDDPYPEFHRFVFDHLDAVEPLLRAGSTQTNEPNRSCLWHVALREAAADDPEVDGRPIALVEVGASAGLNLLVDRYAYDFGDGVVRGAVDSPVRLASELRSEAPPHLDVPLPDIVERVGVDLDPINVRDAEATRWLQACVWPEQLDRHERLRAALTLAAADPPTIVQGDAVDEIADVVEECPDDAHVVVVNSWAMVYLERSRREAFATILDRLGASRPLTWISAEHPTCLALFRDPDGPVDPAEGMSRSLVGMARWRAGRREVSTPALVHPHLRWMDWRAP